MLLRAMSLTRESVPLERPLRSSRGTWRSRDRVLVTVTSERGSVGFGEASPLPEHSPETLTASEALLRAMLDRTAGKSIEGDARLALRSLLAPWDAQRFRVPSAFFAFEQAVIGALAQERDRAPEVLLNAARHGRPVPESATLLEPEDPSATSGTIEEARLRGVNRFKMKLGVAPFDRELEWADRIHRSLELHERLRFDANGSFPLPDVARRLDALAEFGPEFVEEPVHGMDWAKLATTNVPLAADESLADIDASHAILRGLAQVAVVKPAFHGGLLGALSLADLAQARGIAVVVTHMFDGPVAREGCGMVARSLSQLPLACPR